MFALTAAVVVVASASDTNGVSAEVRALRLSAEGIEFFKQRRYTEALVRFEEAYERFPDLNLLYNIGRCHENLDQSELAAAYYQRYVAFPEAPAAQRRSALKRLEKLRLRMSVKAAASVSPVSRTRLPPTRKSSSWQAWTLVGIGGVSLLAAGGAGFWALDAKSRRDNSATLEEKNRWNERAEKRALVADVTGVLGLALVVTGVLWLVIDDGSSTAVAQSTGARPAVGGWLSASGAGLAVTAVF